MLRLRKIVWTVVVVAALGALLSACRYDEIAGNWESIGQRGGLANILEIRPDRTVKSSLLVRIDREYRIEGDKLTIIIVDPEDKAGAAESMKPQATTEKSTAKAKKQPANKKASAKQKKLEKDKRLLSPGEGGEPVIYVLAFDNDRLKLTHEESNQVLDLQREGQAVTPGSIIGHWTFKHQTGQTAHMIFDANGIMHFRMVLPGATDNTYEMKGDTITLYNSANKKSVMSATYKLEDGKLVLDDGKGVTHYARVIESK
jgi:hypothetical protein